MMSLKRLLVAAGIAGICCLLSGVGFGDDPPARSEDEKAIRAVVEMVNLAWTSENGVEVMRQALSSKSFAFAMKDPRDRSRALVYNKTTFLQAFERMMKDHRPKKHAHRTASVTVTGPYGYEVGVTEQTTDDGRSSSENVMLFFAKEDVGWKIISWTPADNVEKAMQDFTAARK